jgi:hypothetical protein
MPIQTALTRLTLRDAIPVGSDFIGGAEDLPVRPAAPGQVVVPGSDFAGGAVPLTAEGEPGEPGEEQVA